MIAQIKVRDKKAYREYAKRFLPLLKRFKGRLLAEKDLPKPEVELDQRFPKTVILEFPDQAQALAWFRSPEYIELSSGLSA